MPSSSQPSSAVTTRASCGRRRHPTAVLQTLAESVVDQDGDDAVLEQVGALLGTAAHPEHHQSVDGRDAKHYPDLAPRGAPLQPTSDDGRHQEEQEEEQRSWQQVTLAQYLGQGSRQAKGGVDGHHDGQRAEPEAAFAVGGEESHTFVARAMNSSLTLATSSVCSLSIIPPSLKNSVIVNTDSGTPARRATSRYRLLKASLMNSSPDSRIAVSSSLASGRRRVHRPRSATTSRVSHRSGASTAGSRALSSTK